MQEHRRKIFELEAKQRVLECTFRNIKQLRSELSYINKEAETRQEHITGFLSAFIPEFKYNDATKHQNNNHSRRGSFAINTGSDRFKSKYSLNDETCDTASSSTKQNAFQGREKVSLKEQKKEVVNSFAKKYKSEKNDGASSPITTPPAASELEGISTATKNKSENPFLKNLIPKHSSSPEEGSGSLPLPKVEYDWHEVKPRHLNKLPIYLPRLGKILY